MNETAFLFQGKQGISASEILILAAGILSFNSPFQNSYRRQAIRSDS